jgi:hypothetical protein
MGRSPKKRAEMTGSDRILMHGRAQVRSSGSTVDEVIYPGPSWVRCGSTSGLGWAKPLSESIVQVILKHLSKSVDGLQMRSGDMGRDEPAI